MRRRTAFTLVELLIVVAIISMLVGILMPALGRAREITRRGVCRKNLHSIGEAMNTYATGVSAYPDLYADRGGTYLVGADVKNENGNLKGNSCNMYVLVSEDMIDSAAFICPSTRHEVNPLEKVDEDDDFLSFENVSYSMHVQRRCGDDHNPLRISSEPDMPVMADRTPLTGHTSWNIRGGNGGSEAIPDQRTAQGGITDSAGEANAERNSYNHQREGQNIVHRDGSATWAATANAGLNGDNIWTWNDGTEAGSTDGRGGDPFRELCPATRKDSFLFP